MRACVCTLKSILAAARYDVSAVQLTVSNYFLQMKEGQDARGARVKTPTRVRSAVAARGGPRVRRGAAARPAPVAQYNNITCGCAGGARVYLWRSWRELNE